MDRLRFAESQLAVPFSACQTRYYWPLNVLAVREECQKNRLALLAPRFIINENARAA